MLSLVISFISLILLILILLILLDSNISKKASAVVTEVENSGGEQSGGDEGENKQSFRLVSRRSLLHKIPSFDKEDSPEKLSAMKEGLQKRETKNTSLLSENSENPGTYKNFNSLLFNAQKNNRINRLASSPSKPIRDSLKPFAKVRKGEKNDSSLKPDYLKNDSDNADDSISARSRIAAVERELPDRK